MMATAAPWDWSQAPELSKMARTILRHKISLIRADFSVDAIRISYPIDQRLPPLQLFSSVKLKQTVQQWWMRKVHPRLIANWAPSVQEGALAPFSGRRVCSAAPAPGNQKFLAAFNETGQQQACAPYKVGLVFP
jgi:hypothetical protein